MWIFVHLILLLLIHSGHSNLADEWVIKVPGGRDNATLVARNLNLVLLDEVIPDSDLYHLRPSKLVKRDISHQNILQKAKHLGVDIQTQKILSRKKRDDFSDENLQTVEKRVCFVSTIPDQSSPSRRCVFPFRYKGVLYQKCTSDHSTNGREWCATSLTGDGEVIKGEWGDCDLDNILCSVIPSPGFSDFQDFEEPSDPRLRTEVSGEGNSLDEGLENPRPPPPGLPLPLPRPSAIPPPPSFLPFGSSRVIPANLEDLMLLLNRRKESNRPSQLIEVERVENQLDESTLNRFSDREWKKQWYLNRKGGLDMNVEEAWDLGYSGKGVQITILDDGIEWEHPDLMTNYAGAASYDINDNDENPSPRYDFFNTNKHGTRCAGQVAAVANNSFCSVGVAFNAGIGGVRMLDGTITDAVEARSLSLNTQYIDIYSASWGPDDDGRTVDGPGPLTRRALEEGAINGRGGLGSIFVWASGNGGKFQDNCNCDGYATSIYTFSVSSASENGLIPWYSEQCSSTLATTYSSGSSRQGERKIVTTDLHGTCTSSHTGTSASSPMAAGILALVLEANPNLTWRDVQHIAVRTSKIANLKANDWRVNGAGYNVSHAFGFGLMDAGAMVKLAKTWTTAPKQEVCEAIWKGDVPIRGGRSVGLTLPLAGDCSKIVRLEHVHLVPGIKTVNRRGSISISLKSPMGTVSNLLAERPVDTSHGGFGGFSTWPLMSTHYWDENPTGNWTLTIRNGGDRATFLDHWKLILYGTFEPHN